MRDSIRTVLSHSLRWRLQFPELAAQQLEVAMKKYGLRGVGIGGSCEGKELSSPEFDPFWAKAEELQALIFIHPQDSANATGIRNRVQGNGVLSNVIGNPAGNHNLPFPFDSGRNARQISKSEDLRGAWRRLVAQLRWAHRSGLPRVSQRVHENHQDEAVGIPEENLCRYDRFQSGSVAAFDRRDGRRADWVWGRIIHFRGTSRRWIT